MKKYVAELLGTFIIVLVGTGAIVVYQEIPTFMNHLGISICFGLAVFVTILLFGKISGAHFNPAVTISLALVNKFEKKEAPVYILMQIIGAVLASAVIRFFFPSNTLLGTTLPSGTVLQSFILEFVLTFILLLAIMLCAFQFKNLTKFIAPIIGVIIFLEAYFAGPYCGASMNPARSIGPALISGHTQHLWLYIVATILGGTVATFFWKIAIKRRY